MVEVLLVAAWLVERAKRRRAEGELRACRREQRRLAGRLIDAQECERRRVARELHDDLNQGLALLAVELDVLARRPPGTASEAAGRLRGLSARVRDLSSAVHALAYSLHPARLGRVGLVAAVRGLCEEVTRGHGLRVAFAHAGVRDDLPDAAALCLFRIAQEALRNAVRHSGADRAAVELTGTATTVRLVVLDRGAGFDPATVRRTGGLGLVGMRERAQLAGGVLTIDARPAGGTRVDAIVPTRTVARQDESPTAEESEVTQAVLAHAPA